MRFHKTGLRLGVLAFALLCIAAGNAIAGSLSLEYQGTTASSMLNGNPIADGTGFTLDATFDETPVSTTLPGQGTYLVSEITANVGGTSYSAIFNTGDFHLVLLDPSNTSIFQNYYLLALVNPNAMMAFAPFYSTATPALDATAATPTVFSGYVTSLGNELFFNTSSGPLDLAYDRSAIATSISPVPEPATLGGAVLAAVAGVFLVRRLGKSGSVRIS